MSLYTCTFAGFELGLGGGGDGGGGGMKWFICCLSFRAVCVCVRERESRQDREKEHVLGLFEVHKICSVRISSAFNQLSFIVM